VEYESPIICRLATVLLFFNLTILELARCVSESCKSFDGVPRSAKFETYPVEIIHV